MLKKTLVTIAAVLAVLILGFVVIVAMQPSEFRVSRSAKMNAPADEVFEQINDFHKWNDWSPWARLDPNAKNSFEGPAAGEGSIFRWAGNADVGEGAMTITESKPAERILLKLEFIKPMAGVSDTLFTFLPEGEHTAVTWTMSGQNNFMGKAFSLFLDCDKMIGEQFDRGLANMKTIVEAEPTGPQIAASPSAASTVASTPAESKSEN